MPITWGMKVQSANAQSIFWKPIGTGLVQQMAGRCCSTISTMQLASNPKIGSKNVRSTAYPSQAGCRRVCECDDNIVIIVVEYCGSVGSVVDCERGLTHKKFNPGKWRDLAD